MSSNLAVMYTDATDPLVKAVIQVRDQLRSVCLIDCANLMKHLTPRAWPAVIESSFPVELLSLLDGAVVLNRMFTLDATEGSSSFVTTMRREIWLNRAFSQLFLRSGRLIHEPGVRGISRSLLPLNLQWYHLACQDNNRFLFPDFVYGFGGELPDITSIVEPLQKSIWSLFDWKVERHLSKEEAGWNKFFVNKPTGTPVICHYLEDDIWATFPRGSSHNLQDDYLRKAVDLVRHTFRSDIGEFLICVEEDNNCRFYAFSPYLTMGAAHSTFLARLIKWVDHLS